MEIKKKRGKEIKIDVSDNYNVVSGTVNNKDAKAIYINISAWGEPTSSVDMNYTRVISRLAKCIKQNIYNTLKASNDSKFNILNSIVDLDMRESGIKFGKKSFMNCEITLYQIGESMMLNDEPMFNALNEVSKSAVKCIDDFDLFVFQKQKKLA